MKNVTFPVYSFAELMSDESVETTIKNKLIQQVNNLIKNDFNTLFKNKVDEIFEEYSLSPNDFEVHFKQIERSKHNNFVTLDANRRVELVYAIDYMYKQNHKIVYNSDNDEDKKLHSILGHSLTFELGLGFSKFDIEIDFEYQNSAFEESYYMDVQQLFTELGWKFWTVGNDLLDMSVKQLCDYTSTYYKDLYFTKTGDIFLE